MAKALKNMNRNELQKEVTRLRKAFASHEMILSWDSMANHYSPNVSQVNYGNRPTEPRKWW